MTLRPDAAPQRLGGNRLGIRNRSRPSSGPSALSCPLGVRDGVVMAHTGTDTAEQPEDSSREPAVVDSERPTDPNDDDALPDHLDVGPEVPVPDAIDQRRVVVLDDDLER